MGNSKGTTRKQFLLHNGGMLLRKQIAYWGERAYPIRIFSEQELKTGTDDWHFRIGFSMYKGNSDGRAIAVEQTLGFRAEIVIDEIAIQANIRHKNVLRLLGCCLETQCPILVYEFISGCRTLSEHLRLCHQGSVLLHWSDRLRIAAEVACALNYLHTHSSMAIIHRDVKPTNILLDESLSAKLTGFDLSLAMPADRRLDSETDLAGTYGYIDPEYVATGVVNEKSDVFNLGVVMLQLLTGKEKSFELLEEPRSIVDYFNFYQQRSRVDEILDSSILCEGSRKQIEAFCEVASECIGIERESRPTMKEVVQKLWQIKNM